MFYSVTACARSVLFSCFKFLLVCLVQNKCHTKFVITFPYIFPGREYDIICFIISLLYKLDTLLIETKDVVPIGYNSFIFPHS